ncbi:hypothetical protein I7I48_00840 [Histoplasma ohiense]|nr:hypothetical protein I7I48_00840 [Histoplasma ohiense (nom. inval.)]
MKRYLSGACILFVLGGISGATTTARIPDPRYDRKFSQQVNNLESKSLLKARSPNGHIAVEALPIHNGVSFHEGDIVINVIGPGDGSNVHVQEQGHTLLFPQVQSPAGSQPLIPFQSETRTPAVVQPAGHTPSPIPVPPAGEPLGNPSTPQSPPPLAQAAPFVIPTPQVQQTSIPADACDCQCLCPFHFFGITAVNLASTVDIRGAPSPTTLATVVSPCESELQISTTAAAVSSSPPAKGTATPSSTSPTILDIHTSSTSEIPVAPVALPEPSKDGAITAVDTPPSLSGSTATSAVELATTNEPARTASTEKAVPNAGATQQTDTEADIPQPTGTKVTATADVAVTSEDPATITDADFTTKVTENSGVSAITTNTIPETSTASTQTGTTPAAAETAQPENDPAAADSFDIGTIKLHSVLTLRLGG